MAGATDNLIGLFSVATRQLDNIPTGSLDVFVDGLKGTSEINVNAITTALKSDDFLKTLAKSDSVPNTNKIALFKKLSDIDDPVLTTAIKNAADSDNSLKTLLKNNLTDVQLKKLDLGVPSPAAGTDQTLELVTVMKKAQEVNPAATAKLESNLAKMSDDIASLNTTLQKQFSDARTEAISKTTRNAEDLRRLSDLEADKLQMLKNDKSFDRATKIFGKIASLGVSGGVAYFAWLEYKKLQKGKDDEILCKMTCLPYNWDSSAAAGFGGTVELGDSTLGYRYLEDKPQNPQSPDDVVIDESKNDDWDWDIQPLCKKAGKPNCDDYCAKKCGEVHDVDLPFEMILGEAGETLGSGVNSLFDGLGLGGLGATFKTIIVSVFGFITLGLLLFLIYKMINASGNK